MMGVCYTVCIVDRDCLLGETTMEYHLMVGEDIFTIFRSWEREQAHEMFNGFLKQWLRDYIFTADCNKEEMKRNKPALVTVDLS